MADTDLQPTDPVPYPGTIASFVPTQGKSDKPKSMDDLAGSNVDYDAIAKKDKELLEHKVGADAVLEATEQRRDSQYRERMDRMIAAEGASMDDVKPWNAEKELAEHKTGLWDQFGSPGFIVSMIASAFTAQPMNSALQSGAAAMNAINQGDMEGYDKAFGAWKENTNLALKRMEMEKTEFDQIDKLRTSDRTSWEAQMRVALTRFNDQRKLALLDAGLDSELMETITGQEKAKEQLEVAKSGIIEQKAIMNAVNADPRWASGDPKQMLAAYEESVSSMAIAKRAGLGGSTLNKLETEAIAAKADELKKSDPKLSSADALTQAIQLVKPGFSAGALQQKAGGDVEPPSGWSQQQFDFAAKIYKRTGHMPPLGLGGANIRAALIAHAAYLAQQEGQTAEEMTSRWADYKSESQTLTKLEQQRAAVDSFSNTALANGEILVDLARKVDQTGIPVIERWERAGRQEVEGDPDVSTFNAQLSAYRNEVARIITNPNLTGVLSVRAMREGESFLKGNMNAAQIERLTQLFKGDFERRRKPLEDEIRKVESVLSGGADVPEKSKDAPASDDGWGSDVQVH